MENIKNPYTSCSLCAHRCGVDRTRTLGACRMTDKLRVARASLHMWEEPPISGSRGSGTVFFSGCSLGCIYCQNKAISRGECGTALTAEELAALALRLEREGAHNINLVTPTHFVPTLREAILLARVGGFSLPVVYNTSAFETPETVRSLSGVVDIYLADLKYYRPETARKYSAAASYPEAARAAIEEMYLQVGEPKFDECGLMTRGVIVRLLLLPGHLAEAKLNLSYLYRRYGDGIYLSLMSQYTPTGKLPPPLDRPVSAAEYRELVDYAERLGVTNAFIQEGSAASESFIPDFDDEGLLRAHSAQL